MQKRPKTHILGVKSPITPPSHDPIMLVFELVQVIATLHVCTKFYKDRTIFATAIVLTDIYIYIYIYIYMYIYIYIYIYVYIYIYIYVYIYLYVVLYVFFF